MKIKTITFLLLTVAAPVSAQEQQVYSPYGSVTQGAAVMDNSYARSSQQSQSQKQYMTYPGREQYGDSYGYVPRHPGDSRAAVDRGAWSGGGGAQMPRRSHSGY